MSSNVVSIPFGDFEHIEEDYLKSGRMRAVTDFIPTINDFCESQGIDIFTDEYKHQVAVIMAQLQSIMMKA